MIKVIDKNGNQLFIIPQYLGEEFIIFENKKYKVLKEEENNNQKIIVVDTNLLLE